MLRDHGYRASASCGVAVYAPAFASTKLYCLVTEAHECEQLAQGCYSTARWPGLKPATIKSLVRCPTTSLSSNPDKPLPLMSAMYWRVVFQVNLTTLDVASNRIKAVENISHLVKLEEFWVSVLCHLSASQTCRKFFYRKVIALLPKVENAGNLLAFTLLVGPVIN